jgi:flavin-dependent dehydrogenase
MADVIVAGGGPAGSATALRLARAGYAVTLLERSRYPRHKPCAEYMSPGVVAQLQRLGVGAEVGRAAGARLDGFTVCAAQATFTARFARVPAGLAPRYGLGIPRAAMDSILAEKAAAAGVDVRQGVRVIDLVWECGGVAGVRALRDGRVEELRAPLVIGADGVRSVVARRLDALELRQGMERIALVAHLAGIDGLSTLGEMHLGRAGYCGVAPLGDGMANVAMVVRQSAVPRLRGRVDAFFWEELAALPHLAARVRQARIIRPVMTIGPLSFHARRLSAAGALLVGDAGGFYDPFTGQGVYRALVSAAIAARVAGTALAAGDVSAARLAAYDQSRRAAFRANHAVEWLVQQFIGRPSLFAHAARHLAERPAMADMLVGVTGDIVPPGRVLSPWFLGRLLV